MKLQTSKFDKFLFWFITIALFCAFALITHVALAQVVESEPAKVESNTMEYILKLGGSLTVSGLLLMGLYHLAQYFKEREKQAHENEKMLEQRNITLEGEKTSLLKEHIVMLEKQNDKLISIIRESQQHGEKILERYLAESEKNRVFFANEYEKQRAMYEKYYTELRLAINQ